jgi:hypothetical protein
MPAENGSSGQAALIARMAEAADGYLAALRADQLAAAALPFDDTQRRRWFYTPTVQPGLPLADMDAAQQRAAHRLAASGLSFPGYVTASTIMGIDNVLDAMEGWRGDYLGRPAPSRFRDPQMYFLAVYGRPGDAAWGWHFGGHHVSLNYTIVDGALVAPSPLFFGAHPADAPLGASQTLRPLGAEEDLGRALLIALDEADRASATLAPVAPFDIVQGNRPAIEDGALPFHLFQLWGLEVPERQAERQLAGENAYRERYGLTDAHLEALRYGAAKGVAAGDLRGRPRDLFAALVRQYVARLPDALASEAEERFLVGDGFAALRFAWAGGAERGQPHYYRIQGPRLLIEYDNAQNDVDHIHTVWRDPASDFGMDILAAHYAQAHT